MSDTVKLIIEIPNEMHEQIKDGYVPLGISKYLKNGIPLDSVKAKIEKSYNNLDKYYPFALCTFKNIVREIFDNIDKAESEDKE